VPVKMPVCLSFTPFFMKNFYNLTNFDEVSKLLVCVKTVQSVELNVIQATLGFRS
jgi:hypothetical protein